MSTVALMHPSGLLGTELREALGERRELWNEIRLFTNVEDEAGTLTEIAGSAAMVTELEEGDLDSVDVAFFCGGIAESRPVIESLPPAATAIVLSPDAAPADGTPVVADVNVATGKALLSPHPGTVLLAHLLHPLREFGPRHAAATLLQPVSSYNKDALEEIFEQTRAILRFDPNPSRAIFPVQLAFNIIPNHQSAEYVIPHLRAVLGDEIEIAAQVLQAGIFHSYGTSLHLELADDPGIETVRELLAAHTWNDMAVDPEELGVIDAAGRDEVIVGPVEVDVARPGSYWIWAVMDNLRCGGALNAIRILEAVRGGTVH